METPSRRPHSYLLSLWIDHHAGDVPVWRGAIVTEVNQRLHFVTLAELNRWLGELSGWQDPPGEPGT